MDEKEKLRNIDKSMPITLNALKQIQKVLGIPDNVKTRCEIFEKGIEISYEGYSAHFLGVYLFPSICNLTMVLTMIIITFVN